VVANEALSRRTQDVARLLGAGYTDRRIASTRARAAYQVHIPGPPAWGPIAHRSDPVPCTVKLGGGLLLVLGLLTPVAATLLIADMFAAILKVHAPKWPSPNIHVMRGKLAG
jgi:uncharacterized membrane protein YphA (DoxX/SURF4 family)